MFRCSTAATVDVVEWLRTLLPDIFIGVLILVIIIMRGVVTRSLVLSVLILFPVIVVIRLVIWL